jgi:ABC-type antimicrobial peptide transport system permease subunit
MSEANFLGIFPDTGGYRFFLMEARNPKNLFVRRLLKSKKDDLELELSAREKELNQLEKEIQSSAGEASTSSRRQLETRAKLLRSKIEELQGFIDAAKRLGNTPLDFLEDALGNEGLHVVDAHQQLAQFMAVQNTYLSTFQSLGALGLLFGSVGLAAVQLRSVLERRAELALMRASGFSRARLVRMVVGENAVLLLGGLIVGCVAAAVALIPQIAALDLGIPWRTLAAMLGTIAMIGLAAGWLATRNALRAPILPALRGD